MKSVVVFLLVGLIGLSACRSAEVSAEDKALFVRGASLSQYGVDVPNPEQYEKFEKTRFFDGSLQIDYEFEPPESIDPAYIYGTVIFEPKASDARLGRAFEDGGITLGLKIYGVEKQEIPGFYKYGDSSRFYALKKDGRDVGNYFTAVDGKKMFSLFMVGLYFDDPESWKQLVEPKLNMLSSYNPK